jgi:hypothetical protein
MQNVITERRQARRENISESVLICPCDPEYTEEVCTTLNVSRNGLYFSTTTEHYFPGMNVIVTLNFHSDDSMQQEYIGDVIRLERLEDCKWGVAIRILMPYNPEVWDATSDNPVL